MSTYSIPARKLTLAAAGSLAFVLSASFAVAQDYGGYQDQSGYYQSGPPERVEVIAPRYRHRSAIGAPIFNQHLTQEVRYDDLDLRTPWGANELRVRVEYSAAKLCSDLEDMHDVVQIDDNKPCVRTAVEHAMYQADEAIAHARQYAYRD